MGDVVRLEVKGRKPAVIDAMAEAAIAHIRLQQRGNALSDADRRLALGQAGYAVRNAVRALWRTTASDAEKAWVIRLLRNCAEDLAREM